MKRERRSGTAADAAPGGRRLRRLLALASASLWWERLWPRLWPAVCIAGGFLAIALLDVLPLASDWLHTTVLVLFAGGFAAAFAWAVPALGPVGRAAARTRLEQDSGLDHRPLAALEDRLAAGTNDALAGALWQRHRERMAAAARSLRVAWPRTDIARHEPWGIRAGVLLLLAVGLAAGWRDPTARLLRAVDPGLYDGAAARLVELWITPPAYTGRSPVFLTTAHPRPPAPASRSGGPGSDAAVGAAEPLAVPRGSALLVRAAGMGRAPTLLLEGAPVDAIIFAPLSGEGEGGRAFRAEAVIEAGERIAVRSGGGTLAEWPIRVLPDLPPQAEFTEPPRPDGNGLLALTYTAADDYGVAEMVVRIEPAADQGDQPGGTQEAAAGAGGVLRVPLALTQPGAAEVEGRDVLDLADRPLAGQPVRLRLEATDGAGQTGTGDWVDVVLPERGFTHPVARAIVEQRRLLATPPRETDLRTRTDVANALVDMGIRPERFGNDVVVSLALAVARSRLMLDSGPDAVPSVRALLWETALRIEQGEVPFAERRLEEARQRLMDALRRDAPQSEIDALMDQVQQALDAYLAAAAAELARRGQQAAPLDASAPMLQSDDLREMLEAARQIARAGGRDAAMQMLSELQRMLDGIRTGLRQGQPNGRVAEAQALMKTLRQLAERQQGLLDDSFQKLREQRARHERSLERPRERGQARQPAQPFDRAPGQTPGQAPTDNGYGTGQGGNSGAGGAEAQQALRRELGDLMLKMDGFLGGIPAPLGEADGAMRNAVEALQQGRLSDAVPGQTRASDALSRALDAAGQAMAQRLGGMMGVSGPGGEDGAGAGDPFGRAGNGRRGFATGDVPIPDRGAIHRAQEILGELRRRAAERSRPAPELDYIERLLRRF